MNHTILVVEDEKELREMMSEALELSGYSVVAAAEGQAALNAIERTESLCLVLLDLLMPGMDGWAFFKEMRARPEYASVPVIVHSSAPASAPQGATRVLQKPVELDRLLDAVHEFCSPRSAPRGSVAFVIVFAVEGRALEGGDVAPTNAATGSTRGQRAPTHAVALDGPVVGRRRRRLATVASRGRSGTCAGEPKSWW